MNSHRRVTVCLATLVVAVGISGTFAQDQQQPPRQPVFRAGTMLVPIDVRVLDKAGKPVTDLGPDEFVVLEDRRPQKVAHFWRQELRPTPVEDSLSPMARRLEARTVGPQTRRVFLIVMGRGRLQPPAKGVDGAIRLVRERLLPQDYVAVLGWNRATDFTTDHQKIIQVLERYKKSHEKIESDLRQQFSGLAAVYGGTRINPSIQKQIDTIFGDPNLPTRTLEGTEVANQGRLNQDNRNAVDALQRAEIAANRPPGSLTDAVDPLDALGLTGMSFDDYVASNSASMQDLSRLYSGINYLRQLDGEKHLLFISERGILVPRVEDDRSLAALASDARVVIDIIHTGGTQGFTVGARGALVPPPLGETARSQMARTVAEQTGGHFTSTSMASAAVDRIDTATRFQYVLGYYTANPTLDGRYRRIIVRVTRPDLTVLYRHGYFARAEPPPLERRQVMSQTRIAAAGNYDGAIPDIKVTATATPTGPSGLQIAVEALIDASRLSFQNIDGRYVGAIDVAVFCGDARQNVVGQTFQRIDFKLLAEMHAMYARHGIPYNISVPVRAPASYVKVVVYDYTVDLLGSAIVKLKK